MNFHKCKKKYMNTDAELITCNITIQKIHTIHVTQFRILALPEKFLIGMHDLYI